MTEEIKIIAEFPYIPQFHYQRGKPTCAAESLALSFEYMNWVVTGEITPFSSISIYGDKNINKNIDTDIAGLHPSEALTALETINALPEEGRDKLLDINGQNPQIYQYYNQVWAVVKEKNKDKAYNVLGHFYTFNPKTELDFIISLIQNNSECIAPMNIWIYYNKDWIEAKPVLKPTLEINKNGPTHIATVLGVVEINNKKYYKVADTGMIREDRWIKYVPVTWEGIHSLSIPVFDKNTFGKTQDLSSNRKVLTKLTREYKELKNSPNLKLQFKNPTNKNIEVPLTGVVGFDKYEALVNGETSVFFGFSTGEDGWNIVTVKPGTTIITFKDVEYYQLPWKFNQKGQELLLPMGVTLDDVQKNDEEEEEKVKEIDIILHEKLSDGTLVRKNPATKQHLVEGLDKTIEDLQKDISQAGKVKSVNGKEGEVVLKGDDIILSDNWEVPIGSIVQSNYSYKAEKSDVEKLEKDLEQKADKNEVVTSVNGQTGDVTIENNGGGESIRSSTIVIANYDSHEKSKKGADIVINKGENASKKINDAIQSLKGIGGEVKLMEGNYNLEYGIVVNVDGVHLTGIPGATTLIQNKNWGKNPVNGSKDIVDTESDVDNLEVTISNLHVRGAGISGNVGFYCTDSSIINNCISDNNGGYGFQCNDSSTVNNCISENNGMDGFILFNSATGNNCISENNSGDGFNCWQLSTVSNCISKDNVKSGFNCMGSSRANNCTSKNNGRHGFNCDGSPMVNNCINKNSGREGFVCNGSSTLNSCISESSSGHGFACSYSSTLNNCISKNSSGHGFLCGGSSTINNCISENSGDNGFICTIGFKGICSFNILKGDKLDDNSGDSAIVEYNIEK